MIEWYELLRHEVSAISIQQLNLEFASLMDQWRDNGTYEKLAFLELVEGLDQAGFPMTANDTIIVMQDIERKIEDARIFGTQKE